jgi:hypothetical protein
MTDKEINMAIEEVRGRTQHDADLDSTHGGSIEWPTDYCNDLNAMHEAEKSLTAPQLGNYDSILEAVCFKANRVDITWEEYLQGVGWDHRDYVYATARQRAETFLKTLDLWKG